MEGGAGDEAAAGPLSCGREITILGRQRDGDEVRS